ncbi:hypothetical protein ABPG77_010365 [Micractinium sp. CCAP 211/92]
MAEGGGLGPVEPGFLDLPTFTLAALLAFFLVLSTLFERSTHWLVHFLKRRKRNGLAQAVSNLVNELTLVGFVSMLLIVFQGPISSICVSYAPGPYEKWSLISNVQGCDCCLSSTASVSTCFLETRECGPGFCNCDAQNASCVVAQAPLEAVLAEWGADPSCQACSAAYLPRVEGSEEVKASSELQAACDGTVGLTHGKCGPGKSPFVTITALHQLHIFIFVVALTHVVMGVGMVVLSSLRLRAWRQCCKDNDDQHAQHVRELRRRQATAAGASPRSASRLRSIISSWRRPTFHRSRLGSDLVASSPLGSASHAVVPETAAGLQKPADSVAIEVEQAGHADAAGAGGSNGSGGSSQGSGGGSAGWAKLRGALHRPDGLALLQAAAGAPAAVTGSQPQQEGEARADQRPAPLPREPSINAASADSGDVNMLAPIASLELEGKESIARNDVGGWAREYAICLLQQFNPRALTHEDVRLMRASFTLTHRVPEGFDFWKYAGDSMEDDFAHIVGVSQEMWFTMIIFVLISGPLGWATTIFLALAAAVLLVINVKLCVIIRHVCRGARVRQLSSNIFWFQRPSLLLHPIKYILFLCSFIMSSAVFFAWSFGASSCPFTAGSPDSNPFYFAQVVPWWAMLLFAGVVYLDASLRTLPTYSLAVQMGSDFKHHMLPQGLREKLLLAAQRIKKKHKALLKEQRSAAPTSTAA